jgi:hypothetical protein
MTARSFACLLTLSLVGLSRGQSLELGVTTGSLGQGISFSAAISPNWTVRVQGTYQTGTTTRPYSSGGLQFASSDRTISGAASVSVDRALGDGFGVTGGLWALVAERKLSLEPVTGLILGTELTPEELGTVSVEISLPQHPVPYLGAYRSVRLFGKWRARAEVGSLYTGRSVTAREATGRLAPTAAWLSATQKSVSPSRFIPVVHLGLSLTLDAPTR